MNYYNEFDPNAAAWLRELIKLKLIPDGIVDERSITEVHPDDVRGFTQCHWFSGIGGWSLALQLAGVPASQPLWTGSCPCQPFSSSGRQLGTADERHLWPVFAGLIRQCRPELIFGEQVAGAIGHGWLDGVSSDLEAEGYTCGASVLGAHSVGVSHIRQRLYWFANLECERQQEPREHSADTSYKPKGYFREADRLVDAVRRDTLPFLCSGHNGIPARVGSIAIKGFGNAIVPDLAAMFIRAAL